MNVLTKHGWQLLGFVESKDDSRFQEAVYKRNGKFKRVLPSGRIRINKPWDWRTDQDRSIIYIDYQMSKVLWSGYGRFRGSGY